MYSISRLLIISPHLDDAVLSCGGRIARTVEAGGAVLVVTCFTSPGEGATAALQQLYKGRRADDAAVMGLLGVEFRHLGFVDAPFRNSAYYNFNTILFHHRLPEEEKSLVLSLGDELRKLVEEWRPDEILFPLGVGGHIDHHLVWESSRALGSSAMGSPIAIKERDAIRTISYYEELPYALIQGWSAVRWNELGGVRPTGGGEYLEGEATARDELVGMSKMELMEAPYPFVQNYMSPGEDRIRSIANYDREFARLGNTYWDAGQWTLQGAVFVRNLDRMPVRYLAAKCQAIAGYCSEWRVLFGTEEGNIMRMLVGRKNLEGTMNTTDTTGTNDYDYTEISWTLKTTR